MLLTQSHLALVDKTISHAEGQAASLPAIMSEMMGLALFEPVVLMNDRLNGGAPTDISAVEAALLFGSMDTVTEFFNMMHGYGGHKNIERVILGNIIKLHYSGDMGLNPGRPAFPVKNLFISSDKDCIRSLGIVDFCLLRGDFMMEENPDKIDRFWSAITRTVPLSSHNKKTVLKTLQVLAQPKNMPTTCMISFFNYLPKGWLSPSDPFLQDALEIISRPDRMTTLAEKMMNKNSSVSQDLSGSTKEKTLLLKAALERVSLLNGLPEKEIPKKPQSKL